MRATKPSITATTLTLLTGLLFALGPVTVDLSLPALPVIQHSAGSGEMRVELTLTLLFLGLALTQLLYGAVADRHGRRLPLLAGLLLYVAGSALAGVSDHVAGIAVARGVQAVGYGVVIVLIKSAVTDVCDSRAAARVYSISILIMSVVAVVAPAVGGQLLAHFGWRSVFFTMAAVGLLALLLAATLLPETQSPENRSTADFGASVATYRELLGNPAFAAFALIASGAVACQFSYNTGGPAVLIEHFGLRPDRAGLVLSAIALSTAAGAQANVFLLRFLSPERVMLGTAGALVGAALVLLAVFLTGAGGLPAVTVLLFIIISTPGLITGNAMAAAMASAGSRAGAASALVGVMQFILGSVGSAVVGYAHDSSGAALGAVILALSLMTLWIALLVRRPRPVPLSLR